MSNQNSLNVAENDLRKLHAEVNQIVSQRFALTTIAVLVFAAVAGWTASAGGKTPSPGSDFYALVSVLLLLVLGALFAYFMMLLGMMRIFTVYIKEKYGSAWEAEWEEYRHEPTNRWYMGYTKAGTFMFKFLGVLSVAFPGGLFVLGGGTISPFPPVLWWPLGFFVLYVAAVHIVSRWREKIFEGPDISLNWQAAINRVAAKRATATPELRS